MSRSYCKVLNDYMVIKDEVPICARWEIRAAEVIKSFRNHNRMCLLQEMKNPDYGDVIFPIYKECVVVPGRGHKPQVSRKEIRSMYFSIVRKILNGYCDEGFIEIYNIIKCLIPDNGQKYGFHEWAYYGRFEYAFSECLYSKKVKRIIKNWTGEPLEVLQYLLDNGFIEEAVRQRYKVTTMK